MDEGVKTTAAARQDARGGSRTDPARRVVQALGGRWGWRFWWPLALWVADVATVATFRPDRSTEPALVILLGPVVAVLVLWVGGARAARRQGHRAGRVAWWAVLMSVVVACGIVAVGTVARLAEAALVGNDRARLFITSLGKGTDHTQVWGMTEQMFVSFGLPLIAVICLVGCVALAARGSLHHGLYES